MAKRVNLGGAQPWRNDRYHSLRSTQTQRKQSRMKLQEQAPFPIRQPMKRILHAFDALDQRTKHLNSMETIFLDFRNAVKGEKVGSQLGEDFKTILNWTEGDYWAYSIIREIEYIAVAYGREHLVGSTTLKPPKRIPMDFKSNLHPTMGDIYVKASMPIDVMISDGHNSRLNWDLENHYWLQIIQG